MDAIVVINIMKKKINLKEITGKGLLNPSVIKIYEVMCKPASKNTSHKNVVFLKTKHLCLHTEKYNLFNTV